MKVVLDVETSSLCILESPGSIALADKKRSCPLNACNGAIE
jgi:hypothetical protein